MISPARLLLLLTIALPPAAASAADLQKHVDLPVPAAPGSQSPRLASGADGLIVLSWLEPAGEAWALRYARWQDGAWLEPASVEMGDNWFVNWADLPAVTPVREDLWVAHWLVRRPAGGYAYDIHVSVSGDGGQTWSAPRLAHGDGTDTEHGFVSVFPASDGAGLVWLDGRRTADEGGMTLRSATLTADGALLDERELDGLICDCCQTGATVAPAGPVVVYRDRTADEVRDIYAIRSVDGAWQSGKPVARDGWVIDGCPVNGPAAATTEAGDVVVAWFTAADGRPRVRLATAAAGAPPYSAPVDVIDGGVVGRVGLALLDDGSAVVSALRTGTGSGAMLTLTRVAPDGGVGSHYVLTTDALRFSVPQLLRSGDQLLIVWPTAGDNGRGLRSAVLPVGAFD